ncbi:hypothetical protein [Clostridium algidicarnis]
MKKTSCLKKYNSLRYNIYFAEGNDIQSTYYAAVSGIFRRNMLKNLIGY